MKQTTIILLIALAFFACDDKGDDPPPDNTPQPHETTITAFGKTITVTGDASIATADFNTAKGKLETALVYASNNIPEGPYRNQYYVMLNRTGFKIIIETGNASPNANASKQMTIGIDFLLDNDPTPAILTGINQKVLIEDAFAE